MKYFISYTWMRYSSRDTEWKFANAVTNEHPIDWLIRVSREHENECYKVIFWQKIDPDEVKTEEWWGNIG